MFKANDPFQPLIVVIGAHSCRYKVVLLHVDSLQIEVNSLHHKPFCYTLKSIQIIQVFS